MELGALDGRTFSNTQFFQQALGWGGVLIEAQPEVYSKLLTKSGRCTRPDQSQHTELTEPPKKRRPGEQGRRVACINAAICDSTEPLEFVLHGPSGGLANHSHQTSHMHDVMQQRKHDHQTALVKCIRMDEILKLEHQQHVDFFSLDVEGAEESVIQTIDANISIGVFLVEHATNPVCEWLLARGMTQVAAGVGQGNANSVWAASPEAAHFQKVLSRRDDQLDSAGAQSQS